MKEKIIVPSGTINNENSIKILNILSENPTVTYDKLSEILSMPRRTVSREMKKLQESGKIEREGAKKSGRWIVKK